MGTGTPGQPGQRSRGRSPAFARAGRSPAGRPLPSQPNARSPRGDPGSKALPPLLAIGEQPRLLFADEIPLFAPQNLCYQSQECISHPPAVATCTFAPAASHGSAPILALFRQQDLSPRPPRCPSLTLPPRGTGPEGFRSLNHLRCPPPGMAGSQQRGAAGSGGKNGVGAGDGGAEPLPGA